MTEVSHKRTCLSELSIWSTPVRVAGAKQRDRSLAGAAAIDHWLERQQRSRLDGELEVETAAGLAFAACVSFTALFVLLSKDISLVCMMLL